MDVYRLIKPASVIFVLLGLLVMLGWIVDIPILKAPIPDTPLMKFTTALSVMLGGVLLRSFSHIVHAEKQSASMIKIMVSGCFLFMISFPLLAGYFFDIDTGFEVLSFDATNRDSLPSLGSILSVSLLFGMAFLVAMGHSISKTAKWGGLALLGVGGLALVGYILGNPPLYYLTAHSTGMALHTAGSFALIGYFFFMLGIRPHPEGIPIASEEGVHAHGV